MQIKTKISKEVCILLQKAGKKSGRSKIAVLSMSFLIQAIFSILLIKCFNTNVFLNGFSFENYKTKSFFFCKHCFNYYINL